MRHYNFDKGQRPISKKEQKKMVESAIEAQLLQQLRYFDSFVDYAQWKPKDLNYMSQNTFNELLLKAYKKYSEEGESLLKTLTPRKKTTIDE